VHNFFLAGPDLVRWDLTALGAQGTGPYRLVVEHKTGCITEHFDTVASGLLRQGELETLLIAARGPVALDPNPKSWQSAPAAPVRSAPTILVIDDDRSVTETFATALNREGFNVRTAANAETGLREAAAHHADAIIVDLRMPLINGLGFLYRLRTSDEHRNTPVAIVTGAVVDDSMQAELNELGAELRFKPLWLEDVVQLAHQLVARGA
jgi:CheY-like chemotaxis protein